MEVSHYMEENFLDTVASELENIWQTTINLCGVATWFKVDTGAGITAISEGMYRKLGNQPLRTPDSYIPSVREVSDLKVKGA